ncbi:MAG: GNAT family N-acetyltransferase, partial [bacterium]|nr:GNAT family N-acetyltransferase [bacterium]
LDGLAAIHAGNMRALGGLAKPRRFFRLIAHHFEYEKDFKLYTAYDRETPVSSLLLFYFNKTVEVFAIATLAEYRSRQPSSLLTFQGMRDAALRGMAWWNWGGTWASQKGVYHFKKHWGAEDFPYYYYTRILDARLRDLSKETLLEQYPYFFVLPFGELSHAHF